MDVAAHDGDDVLGDGHAEPRPLNGADGFVVRTFKRLEEFFQKIGLHADPGIRNDKFITPEPAFP